MHGGSEAARRRDRIDARGSAKEGACKCGRRDSNPHVPLGTLAPEASASTRFRHFRSYVVRSNGLGPFRGDVYLQGCGSVVNGVFRTYLDSTASISGRAPGARDDHRLRWLEHVDPPLNGYMRPRVTASVRASPSNTIEAVLHELSPLDAATCCRVRIREGGFEPPTFASGGRCSVQLSYSRSQVMLPYDREHHG